MNKQSESNKKIIEISRIIRPESRKQDIDGMFDHIQDIGGLFWQNWLITWCEFLEKNKKTLSAVRLSRSYFELSDGHIYLNLDVSVCYRKVWHDLQMNKGYDEQLDKDLNALASGLSDVRDAIRDNDLWVLPADACPHANAEDFMHNFVSTEYNRERFMDALRNSWGNEANLVQESTLRNLVDSAPTNSKKKL